MAIFLVIALSVGVQLNRCPSCGVKLAAKNARRHQAFCCPDLLDPDGWWHQGDRQTVLDNAEKDKYAYVLRKRFDYRRDEQPPTQADIAQACGWSPRRTRDVISSFLHRIPPQPDFGPIEIIYEDDRLVACNKPAGLPVSPPHRLRGGSLLSRLIAHLKQSPSGFVPAPVHRLDLNTSGAIIFAKDAAAASSLMQQFEARSVGKEYAVMSAASLLAPAVVDRPICKLGGTDRCIRRVCRPGEEQLGQSARTHLVAAARAEGASDDPADGNAPSLIIARAEGGRTHQVRLHCAAAGVPLLGDQLYSTIPEPPQTTHFGDGRFALHALTISLKHPSAEGRSDGKLLQLTAPLPDDFLACARALKLSRPAASASGHGPATQVSQAAIDEVERAFRDIETDATTYTGACAPAIDATWTVKRLQAALRERGLPVSGRKAQLLERLGAAETENDRLASPPRQINKLHPRAPPPHANAAKGSESSLRGLKRRSVTVDLDTSSGASALSLQVQEIDDWEWWEKQSESEQSNPYGAKLWPAAVAVAEFLAALPLERWQGLTVLELGCGNGLCSMVAAIRGARSVLATDISMDALVLTAEAAMEQGLYDPQEQSSFATLQFDMADRAAPLPPADLVIAADLLYDEHLATIVAGRVAEAAKRGSWVVVGDQRRSGRDAFLRSLHERMAIKGAHTYTFDPPARETCVRLPQVGWKEKRCGLLRINDPEWLLQQESMVS